MTGAAVVFGIPKIRSIAGFTNVARRASGLKSAAVVLLAGLLFSLPLMAAEIIILRKGYLKKFPCQGRLFATGIGDESVVEMEALPQNLGCGVILKPLKPGSTNMILETSTGTVERLITVQTPPLKNKNSAPEVKK